MNFGRAHPRVNSNLPACLFLGHQNPRLNLRHRTANSYARARTTNPVNSISALLEFLSTLFLHSWNSSKALLNRSSIDGLLSQYLFTQSILLRLFTITLFLGIPREFYIFTVKLFLLLPLISHYFSSQKTKIFSSFFSSFSFLY